MEILCPKSKIITNESTEIIAITEHRRNSKGLPDILYYHKEGCFEFGFDPIGAFPKGHAIIQNDN
jgi:hypothetical protein